jgi:hypothetical protein
VGNRENTISQRLKHLEPRTTYTFSASFQAPSAGSNIVVFTYTWAAM